MRNAKQLAKRLGLAHMQGALAKATGLNITDCPYDDAVGSLAWRMGYNYQQRDDRHDIYDGEWLNKRTA